VHQERCLPDHILQKKHAEYVYWQKKAASTGDEYAGALKELYLLKEAQAWTAAYEPGVHDEVYANLVATQMFQLQMVTGNETAQELAGEAAIELARVVVDKWLAPAVFQGIALVGGRKPINSGYAGSTFHFSGDLGKEFPNGVEFSSAGYPDFTPYAVTTVQIQYTGDRKKDFAAANAAAGLDVTPENYTWHHVEDMTTMQLVRSDIHDAVRHTGGMALYNSQP
jgi:hypothetical protein